MNLKQISTALPFKSILLRLVLASAILMPSLAQCSKPHSKQNALWALLLGSGSGGTSTSDDEFRCDRSVTAIGTATAISGYPQWSDTNALAAGKTLVYGLDFQDDINPLTNRFNSSKNLMYSIFSKNITRVSSGTYSGWNQFQFCKGTEVKVGYVRGDQMDVDQESYPTWSDLPVKLGPSVVFPLGVDNTDNIVEIPDIFAGQTLDQGSFFMEWWMKPSAYNASEVPLVYRWGSGVNNNSFAINYFHNNIAVYVSTDGSTNAGRFSTGSDSYIRTGQLTHVAVAFSPTQLKIYVAGALVKTFTSADGYTGFYNPTNTPLRVGQNYSAGFTSNHFQGKIFSLRVMNGKLVDNDASSLMRASYGFQNKATGLGPSAVAGFIDNTHGSDRFFKLRAEDTEYSNKGYDSEFDYGLYYPVDPTLGITRDFLSSVDYRLPNSGSNRYHALLTKGYGPGEAHAHFQMGVLVDHPIAYLYDASGTQRQIYDTNCTLVSNVWYRSSLVIAGNLATLQTIRLDTGVISTQTLDITGFVPDANMGVISSGKSFGHSGASHADIDNIKIYKN